MKALDNPSRCGRNSDKHNSSVFLSSVFATKNPQPNELESINYYRKNVFHFLNSYKIRNKFGSHLINRMLKDEECISYLMFSFMKADWIYKPDGGASKITLRYSAGLWFIYKYIKHLHRSYKKPLQSLDFNLVENSVVDIATTKPLNTNHSPTYNNTFGEVLQNERQRKLRELTQLPCLTMREQWMMGRYYLNRDTLQKIGLSHHVSRERVRQILVSAIRKIQYYIMTHEKLREYWSDEKNIRVSK
uniref:Putative sigma-70 region domain containing protein n=1 Tax=viral metagenome TaxID=1070528 RepID=A0A6M3JQP6_9ZZZZ